MMFGSAQVKLSARTMLAPRVWACSGETLAGNPFGGVAVGWEPPLTGQVACWHHVSDSAGAITYLFVDAASAHVAYWVQRNIDGVGVQTAAFLLGLMHPSKLLKACQARNQEPLKALGIRLGPKSILDLIEKVPKAPWAPGLTEVQGPTVTSVRTVALLMGHAPEVVDRALADLHAAAEVITTHNLLGRIACNTL